MFLVDPDDIIAIHRANDLGGRDTAIAEVRRRWPALADRAMAGVLDRVLAIKVEVPVIPERTHPPSPGTPEGDERRQKTNEKKRRDRERDRLRRDRIRAGLE